MWCVGADRDVRPDVQVPLASISAALDALVATGRSPYGDPVAMPPLRKRSAFSAQTRR